MGSPLVLPGNTRRQLWVALGEALESYLNDLPELGAATAAGDEAVATALAAFDFDNPLDPQAALSQACQALRTLQGHTGHPRYFGLFEAAPATMGIIGETIAAAFNACLATRDSSPFGTAAEERLISEFGAKFGYRQDTIDGIITTGGSESNHTALLTAIARHYPEHRSSGFVGITGRPVVYTSAESHPSIAKAVMMSGLGMASYRPIPPDASYRLDVGELRRAVTADLRDGNRPLMVAATAGTTGSGAVDSLRPIAEIAVEHGLWMHVDAAWGGAAALLPEMVSAFDGLADADSISFDPHKWMSVPLGAGFFLTRHPGLLSNAFGITAAFLNDATAAQPFARSMRWSRGFAGLKVLLTLTVTGWSGYQQVLRRQIALGDRLRQQLTETGWRLVNDTPLPVVCFDVAGASADSLAMLAKAVNTSGEARIYLVYLGTKPVLRACITNPATTESDIDELMKLLGRARADLAAGRLDETVLSGIPVNAGSCQCPPAATKCTRPA